VPSPSPTQQNAQNTLTGVVSLRHDDAWAVGTTLVAFSRNQTLVEHWNGTAWAIVTSPNPFPGQDYLAAVACSGPFQLLWTVGTGYGTSGSSTLVLTTSG
jgi:hypothetical protein